ncbi:MAG: DUF1127 domain-containing protein [Cellvibrionaceae bacterium]
MTNIAIQTCNPLNVRYHSSSKKIQNILSKIALYGHRYRSRRQLAQLSPEHMKDIGISREQALVESKKLFWK